MSIIGVTRGDSGLMRLTQLQIEILKSTVDDSYEKGEYSLSVPSASATAFTIEAIWVDNGIGIDDRWTINQSGIEPVCDTTKDGIKGYSVFNWLFD